MEGVLVGFMWASSVFILNYESLSKMSMEWLRLVDDGGVMLRITVLGVLTWCLYRFVLKPLFPPPSLMAIALPRSRETTTRSHLRPSFLPSPALIHSWWRLARLHGCWPWQLEDRVVQSAYDIDWHVEGVKDGDAIQAWDRVCIWSSEDDCLPLSALKKWEGLADPLSDAAFAALQKVPASQETPDEDNITKLHRVAKTDAASEKESSVDATALQMLRQYHSNTVSRRPPRGAGVIPLEWYARRDARRGRQMPAWLRREQSVPFDDLIRDEDCDKYNSLDPKEDGSFLYHLEAEAQWQNEEWASLTAEEREEELREERRLIKEGQDTFYRYSGGILLSLLHFSLAGGFASPRLTSILQATAYLIPPDRKKGREVASEDLEQSDEARMKKIEEEKKNGDKTWKRLIETTQWVLDVMETVDALDSPGETSRPRHDDATEPDSPENRIIGGAGLHSSLQVRFLHSRVRHRLSTLPLPPGVVPLNQADLLSTLLSFSAAPLSSLSRMGLSPLLTSSEREAYIGLWRHIGWLIGVDSRLVRRCLATPQSADRALFSCVVNLFDPSDLATNGAPTYRILASIADRPPFRTKLPTHIALASSLVGPTLSQALQLPHTSLFARLGVKASYLGIALTVLFGKVWIRGEAWERKRARVTRILLRKLIQWNLGMQSSRFQSHSHSGGQSSANGAINNKTEDLGKVKAAVGGRGGDGHLSIGIVHNEVAAKRDVGEYRAMIREMIVGYILLVAVPVATAMAGWRWYMYN